MRFMRGQLVKIGFSDGLSLAIEGLGWHWAHHFPPALHEWTYKWCSNLIGHPFLAVKFFSVYLGHL